MRGDDEPGRSRALSDAEWKVMTALWRRGRAGVAELHRELAGETGWAYSTVKTLLARLAEKGAVAIEAARGGREFVPRLSESAARRTAFRALLERAFGGRLERLAQHLVEGGALTRRERRELAELLSAEEAKRPPGAKAKRTEKSG